MTHGLAAAGYVPGRVSVVVPILNGAATLERCIQSFADQTYQNKELVLVDGGSTDGTLEIIRRYDSLATALFGVSGGVYKAFNRGVACASGEWILFLGSDDRLWDPHVLENMSESLMRARLTGQRLVYGKVAVVTADEKLVAIRGRDWAEFRRLPPWRWTFEHQGIFHHKSLFHEHGGFDESFEICGDQDFLLRELRHNTGSFQSGIIVAAFRLGGISSRPEKLTRMLFERTRSFRRNGVKGLVTSPLSYFKVAMLAILPRSVLRRLRR